MFDTYFDKDDGGTYRKQTVQLHENVVLVTFRGTVHVELLDAFDGKLFMPKSDLIGLGCKFIGVGDHLIRKCSRE